MFIESEVRCFNRGHDYLSLPDGENTFINGVPASEHVQERMDWYFGKRYHQEIWSRLLEAVGIDNWRDKLVNIAPGVMSYQRLRTEIDHPMGWYENNQSL